MSMRTQVAKCLPAEGVAFSNLSAERLKAMRAAAEEVVAVHRVLEKTGDNVVSELLRGNGTFYEWDHYPKGDVYDSESHAQYYYHAHPPEERFEGEHGHFHTFLRPKGMPLGVRPAPVPKAEPPVESENDALSHLIAIAMDAKGFPIRLFTVNRWVTGETWYVAQDVIRMLDCFEIGHARPSWPANRWVTAMLRLFRPQIEQLIRERDACVADWQREYAPKDVYEDRKLEVTSYVDINIERQAEQVAKALAG